MRIINLILFFTVIFLSSCSADTVSLYSHEASMDFFETGYFEAKNLKEYRHENVLITTGLGNNSETGEDKRYSLWIGFYSPDVENKIFVKSVEFSNEDKTLRKQLNQEIFYEKEFKGLNETSLRVFDNVTNDFIDDKFNEFFVTVEFEINSTPKVQNFTIVRKKILVPIH